jgi:hypothetical protein
MAKIIAIFWNKNIKLFSNLIKEPDNHNILWHMPFFIWSGECALFGPGKYSQKSAVCTHNGNWMFWTQ